jgi:catechol 2,3-dioxygenase-like lactoylglutathione lyase family enzyme
VAVRLNHTIVPARDGEAAARWLAELFGMPPPEPFGPFWQVTTANGVDLDFDTYGEEPFTTQHYAFLVDEAEFDAIHGRILDRGLNHWADPSRRQPGRINHHDGGRGVYFADPDGHLLEIITRPYGGWPAGSPQQG